MPDASRGAGGSIYGAAFYMGEVMDPLREWRLIERMLVGDFDPDQPRDDLGRWTDGGVSYIDADDEDEWIEANIHAGGENKKRLMDIYENGGSEAITGEFWRFKTNKATKPMDAVSDKEADEILNEHVPRNVFLGWFRDADSNYKPRIAAGVLKNAETRNAALSNMYANYKLENGKEALSYEEFLNTPITLYRGDHGQKMIDKDVFMSYSPDKKMAEKFVHTGGKLSEIKIKPKDTWGSINTAGEAEVMVPTYMLKEV